MTSKKPDQVVFNEEENKYDAGLKPYATDVSAPAITTVDTIAWKNSNINKVNHQIKTRYDKLKEEYDALMAEYEYNNLVYQARFNFEPIVGQTYHLYKDKKEQLFLSIIAPSECNFHFLGSFQLTADKLWQKMD
ncbi:DUF2452 domain-containing protein [Aquimarina sp. ERC-38]|uniref:DUF2452 domain-containing protein n=1 Tax=Aquimarina sp. ERC-38 TaxID=2949996 RepID=UPI002247718F|nr:DUF2452 domain-containing protein [Aquimarina sp. ERC-38]UZO82414.1 DUF2452 domain-containing protein [Aquimarina sp. ERC-38]